MQSAVIYKAEIKPQGEEITNYIGLTEPNFKGRWADHRTSFRFPNYRKNLSYQPSYGTRRTRVKIVTPSGQFLEKAHLIEQAVTDAIFASGRNSLF